MDELARLEARERVRKQQDERRERQGRISHQSEQAFWRDTAAFMQELERDFPAGGSLVSSRDLAEVGDPVLEAEEEKAAEEARIARLPDPETEADRFWDESAALIERMSGVPKERAEVEELERIARMSPRRD
jgi:hypothetical protein